MTDFYTQQMAWICSHHGTSVPAVSVGLLLLMCAPWVESYGTPYTETDRDRYDPRDHHQNTEYHRDTRYQQHNTQHLIHTTMNSSQSTSQTNE